MKEYSQARQEVIAIITAVLNTPEGDIDDSSRISDLSADSIQLFELLLAFEKAYAIETAYDDVVQLHTVHDIVVYIQQMTGDAPPDIAAMHATY